MPVPAAAFPLSSMPAWQTLRHAARRLRRAPGFALICIATLALCIGAVTAIFSVVYGVLLQPYGFGQQGKLIVWHETVREMQATIPLAPVNFRHFRSLESRSQTLQAAALVQPSQIAISAGTGHPQVMPSLYVTQNYFAVMQTAPALGRFFLPADFRKGAPAEAVLSWGAWQQLFPGQRFGQNRGVPSAGNPVLRIGGFPYTVVGVLPSSFLFPPVSVVPGTPPKGTETYRIFLPHSTTAQDLTGNDNDFNYIGIGRLRPGVSIAAAQNELDGIEKATTHGLPVHLGVVVASFGHEVTGSVQKPLLLLLLAVGGVLLIGCVNLASLQLARSLAQQGEQALRSALGAPRLRLLQDALAEDLLLACDGGGAAIAVAWVGLRVLLALAPAGLPRVATVHLSLPVLALSAALSLVTSVTFGILPALRALRMQPIQAMQGASGRVAGDGRSGGWLRQGILATQIGCSVVLLVAMGVVTQSFGRLLAQAQAFANEPVTMAQADLQAPQYSDGGSLPDNPGADAGSLHRNATIGETLRRLAALPAVQTAALTSVLPLTGDMSLDEIARPDHPVPQGQTPLANLRMVSPGYFRALGIPLEQGRDFTAGDRDHARVAIVSAATARAAWGQESPIGHTIMHWGRTYTVVGVAADARINDLRRDASIFYLPYWDYPPFSPVYLVQTSHGAAGAVLDPQQIRKAIWSVDPQVAIPTVLPLKVQTAQSVALERFQTLLLAGFGVAALLLAALGVYGVLSYEVNLRRREWGIRMALGSSRGRLFRRVLLSGATPACFGAVLGSGVSFAAVRWLQSFLYGAAASDLPALWASLGVLTVIVLAASFLPARRAAASEPASVLRGE